MAQRQTASFLIKRFREAGIRPRTRHGQNFLIDLNLVQFLADSARLEPTDVVLEVGTGTGSLTSLLATRAAHVVTAEIDHQLFQLASEQLVDFENITMLQQDVLRNKNNLHESVLEIVDAKLEMVERGQFKLVANLPYNVATPILSNLLVRDKMPHSMTVTIQKELADRIVARPSTKDYSALSVWMQSLCQVEVLKVLPPTVFWPRPQVHSAIIRITPQRRRREQIPDVPFFHRFVRSMFLHRRKFLRSVVLAAFKNQLDKPAVDGVLEEQGLTPQAAEELDVEQMLALCEAVRRRLPAPTS